MTSWPDWLLIKQSSFFLFSQQIVWREIFFDTPHLWLDGERLNSVHGWLWPNWVENVIARAAAVLPSHQPQPCPQLFLLFLFWFEISDFIGQFPQKRNHLCRSHPISLNPVLGFFSLIEVFPQMQQKVTAWPCIVLASMSLQFLHCLEYPWMQNMSQGALGLYPTCKKIAYMWP